MVRGLLESIMCEERVMDLEEHPTKASGYSTRDFLTRVPRVREGDFPQDPP